MAGWHHRLDGRESECVHPHQKAIFDTLYFPKYTLLMGSSAIVILYCFF